MHIFRALADAPHTEDHPLPLQHIHITHHPHRPHPPSEFCRQHSPSFRVPLRRTPPVGPIVTDLPTHLPSYLTRPIAATVHESTNPKCSISESLLNVCYLVSSLQVLTSSCVVLCCVVLSCRIRCLSPRSPTYVHIKYASSCYCYCYPFALI